MVTTYFINNLKNNKMRKFYSFCALAVMSAMLLSCSKDLAPVQADPQDDVVSQAIATKAYGSVSPKIAVYVETNDENPLNAGDYYRADGTALVDMVELFAANLNKETVSGVVRPTLYLNDKLTNVLENGGVATYVQPLQAKGIKVLLTVLGNHTGLGFGNMTSTQVDEFTDILAYAVTKYGLDGIGFDDEYADYNPVPSSSSTSFADIITSLRSKLATGKLITVFGYGDYISQINATAGAAIDYAYTNFSFWNTSISISGVTYNRWAPSSYNLGNSYLQYYTSAISTYATQAKNNGYGAIMCFNLRRYSEVNPTPVFNAIASGAFSTTVTRDNGDRARDAGSVSGGYTITIDDVE